MSVLLDEGHLRNIFQSADRRGAALDTALFFKERPLVLSPSLEMNNFGPDCRFIALPHVVLQGIDARGAAKTPDYPVYGPAALDGATLTHWRAEGLIEEKDICINLDAARERALAHNTAAWSAFATAQQRGSFAPVDTWQTVTASDVLALRHNRQGQTMQPG